ncbi:sulfur carrier protein ThiS [Muribaculum caecicola]|jgi:sulfur carrier protein|uniref:Sulfur carrier protein ThiS n=1 Tax=Muribaculum caecicola TaxID=3038144 RepID=A0AC61S624_9BACT|nr:sulfur carrier protein ThiS [Muribaculum caecicola]THG53586.1 sulfur carrier protein ThiS [Muribaculum caecicola]
MKILINHSPLEVAPGTSVADVLLYQGMSGDGIAVAVNNKVVPRGKWNTTYLFEGARLTVIRAVCGG